MSACKHLSDKSGCIVDLLVAHGADVFWTDHRTRSGNTFPHSTAICVFQEEKEENTVANSVFWMPWGFHVSGNSVFPPPPNSFECYYWLCYSIYTWIYVHFWSALQHCIWSVLVMSVSQLQCWQWRTGIAWWGHCSDMDCVWIQLMNKVKQCCRNIIFTLQFIGSSVWFF